MTPKPRVRYKLPADLTPNGTWCVQINIPADSEYLAQLADLIDSLTYSANFERDPTATHAAIVSRTWQNAIQSEPIEIGCEVITDLKFRPHPSDPCKMQYSTNGGDDWELAFNIADCFPVVPEFPTIPPMIILRPAPANPAGMEFSLNGGEDWLPALDISPVIPPDPPPMITLRPHPNFPCVMQQSHDNGETWYVALNLQACNAPTPYPAPVDGNAETMTTNIICFLADLVGKVVSGDLSQFSCNEIGASVNVWAQGIVGPCVLGPPLRRICDALGGRTDEYRDQFRGLNAWGDFYDHLLLCIDDNGFMTYTNLQQFIDYTTLADLQVFKDCLEIVVRLNDQGLLGHLKEYCTEVAFDPSSWAWSHEFVFTDLGGSADGWEAYPGYPGLLTILGWYAMDWLDEEHHEHRGIRINLSGDRVHLKSINFSYDMAAGNIQISKINYRVEGDNGTTDTNSSAQGTYQIHQWYLDDWADKIRIDLLNEYDNAPGSDPDAYIHTATITGRGVDPWL